MFRLTSLASGSSGNATLIESEQSAVLLDCGISRKKLLQRLEEREIDFEKIEAVVVTHEHGDHISGLRPVCSKVKLPVYCNANTGAILARRKKLELNYHLFDNGSRFSVGDIEIEGFSVPHDGVDTCAYSFYHGQGNITVVTDLGSLTPLVKARAAAADVLFLEANHDLDQLMNCGRPWRTIQRIMGPHGHLNNEQAAELLRETLPLGRLKNLMLGHVSRDANDYGQVKDLMQQLLDEAGLLESVGLRVSTEEGCTDSFSVS